VAGVLTKLAIAAPASPADNQWLFAISMMTGTRTSSSFVRIDRRIAEKPGPGTLDVVRIC
jgi:hypothetical protein